MKPPRTLTLPQPRRRQLLLATAALGLAACSRQDEPAASAAASGPLSDEQALSLAATGHGFPIGAVMAAHMVHVFFDTTCPHCAHLWQAAQPLLGKLKMVWMPVGLLRPQSGPQGATILAAADPVAAMNENESSVLAHGGGITAATTPDAGALAHVQANGDILRRLGAQSVPVLLARHAQTGRAVRQEGALDTAGLAAFVGLAA